MREYRKTRWQKLSGSLLCSREKVYGVIDIMSSMSLDISLRKCYIAVSLQMPFKIILPILRYQGPE